MRDRLLKWIVAAAGLLVALTPAVAQVRRTPSGLPVPRWVSLKFDKVNARAGPSDDQRLLWVYRAKGLPVQVVAETAEWRRVCDPEGGLVWVHKRTTDGRLTAMRLKPGPLALRRAPHEAAETVARLRVRAIASLDKCEGGWCKLKADGAAGWAPARELWGTSNAVQCR
jgi:SH3-like domain-containing protein